ncbi:hypothetical protein Fot_22013 [Forsythia ovata]|uniref:Uncharacterized protein n=1 Tax=Forsythia ovata TaxID=205694 RepID=A0ABD1UWJ0_9LAMI
MDLHSNAQEEILTQQIKRRTKLNNLSISDRYVPNVEKDTEANVSKEQACVTLVAKVGTWQRIARERLINQISKQQHGFFSMILDNVHEDPAVISGDVQGKWVVAAERREMRWVTTTDFWSYLTHAPGYYIWEYTVIRTEVYDMDNNGWFLKGIYLEIEI